MKVAEVAREIADLRKTLSGYDIDNIYNVDETGLFYKLLPRKMYILPTEDKKSLRGLRQ